MKFRCGYEEDAGAWSDASGIACDPLEKRAKDSFKDECDINTIVERFGLTGQLPQDVRPPVYGDFVEALDYRSALDALRRADDSFMAMPADVRARFGNDAAAFVDFCSDPSNLEEMRKLGLAVPAKVEEPPLRVEVVAGAVPAAPLVP